MLIISTFAHSIEIEQALAVLEHLGVERNRIMTVAMDRYDAHADITASRFTSKTTLAFEVGMASATACCTIGISLGFVLSWGPIIWGSIASISSFGLAYGITRWVQSRTAGTISRFKDHAPDLAVIIECQDHRARDVQRILWEYQALSVGKIGTVPAGEG